ncbi:helix-turn-helix domain-containing protein [Acetobacter sacchari]|uniref:Helix-turn-helix domain-containing protein n=1 Tax=Acetobacter sacchari TaxID=2661687 RepID=A0ABS3M1H6_9PROT|nr:helix-turn-helix domain-containing protein [Acetobacter sacchari]
MSEAIAPLLTVYKAAAIVGCCDETIRRAIRSGKLAAYRRPRCTRIAMNDLKAYLDTYHCPASEMTSPTWNYVAANGPSSGGKTDSAAASRLAQRMRNALDKP